MQIFRRIRVKCAHIFGNDFNPIRWQMRRYIIYIRIKCAAVCDIHISHNQLAKDFATRNASQNKKIVSKFIYNHIILPNMSNWNRLIRFIHPKICWNWRTHVLYISTYFFEIFCIMLFVNNANSISSSCIL